MPLGNKNRLGPIALVLACGTSLFSDGYLNGSLGSARTFLIRQYGAATFNGNDRGTVFSSMGFVGIVLGQLSFGWIVDKIGRRNSMFFANIIVIVFSILQCGAYGPNPDVLFRVLTAWRFFQGVSPGMIGLMTDRDRRRVSCGLHRSGGSYRERWDVEGEAEHVVCTGHE